MGLAVADALGVPVEFCSREYLKNNPVKEMMGYGTYNQPEGSWSDDTSLTLGLLDALSEEKFSIKSMADKFVSWYRFGEYTPNGVVFDIGNATREALIRIGKGVNPLTAGGKTEYDNGNGSLMRILPLAFYLKDEDNIEERIRKIYEVSSITHGHIRSKMACHIYVEMAIKLIKGATLEESYLETINEIKEYYQEEKELATFKRILSGDINCLNEDEVKSSGYVIDTLEAALWCSLTTSSYKEAVLKAVNLGSDTDTVAAVTGGLAGIYYGIESIPQEWIQVIINKELIYELSESLNKKL
ncbi:MAG: ADP-ribosylglycohydrolase family protein [Clostridium sp.]|nr:ADP-ribosylglycohydrolase family protein [Clostridium sp.]